MYQITRASALHVQSDYVQAKYSAADYRQKLQGPLAICSIRCIARDSLLQSYHKLSTAILY